MRLLILAGILSLIVFDASANGDNETKLSTSTEHHVGAYRADAAQTAQDSIEEIVTWLSSNFDLPAIRERPAIEFASKTKLTMMRLSDHAYWQGFSQDEDIDQLTQRTVAIYDTSSKTILLPEEWIGRSPADQSVLVHEMVHHVQNLAKLKYECPSAREKVAYLAQDKWLERFGKNLENEFGVDMFTVVVSSACM
jgi:hypothetical protein